MSQTNALVKCLVDQDKSEYDFGPAGGEKRLSNVIRSCCATNQSHQHHGIGGVNVATKSLTTLTKNDNNDK